MLKIADLAGDYYGDVIAGVTSLEEYQERDIILSDVAPPQTNPDKSSTEFNPPIRDPPGRAPAQFRPLNILRFGIQPIAPRLMLLR